LLKPSQSQHAVEKGAPKDWFREQQKNGMAQLVVAPQARPSETTGNKEVAGDSFTKSPAQKHEEAQRNEIQRAFKYLDELDGFGSHWLNAV
jgi:hypothetical protein